MESLLKALAEKGVDAESMSQEQVLKVAKAVGIDPDNHLPRKEVVVGPYTNIIIFIIKCNQYVDLCFLKHKKGIFVSMIKCNQHVAYVFNNKM